MAVHRNRRRFVSIALMAAVAGPAVLSLPGVTPAVRADEKADAEARKKWEPIVQLYGQEATNQFSLRILDKDAKFEGNFVFKECWKYDRNEKKWVRISNERQEKKVKTADRKAENEDPDSQLLAELPIMLQDVGLYYIKWDMDGVACTTYARLGPKARDRKLPAERPTAGQKIEDVPIDPNKAAMEVIPDPIYHTGEGSKKVPGK